MNQKNLANHLQTRRYGDFQLTDAIRPSLDLAVVPQQGYRRDTFRDSNGTELSPALVASVSAEHLFDVFLDLVELLGESVDVVIESSHDVQEVGRVEHVREHIDLPVLMSYFCEHEDLLLNDGCTGVSVMVPRRGMEVQFDEHKLLIVYAPKLKRFEKVLRSYGIVRNPQMKLITEAEHLHSSEERHRDTFDQFCCVLGAAEPVEWANW